LWLEPLLNSYVAKSQPSLLVWSSGSSTRKLNAVRARLERTSPHLCATFLAAASSSSALLSQLKKAKRFWLAMRPAPRGGTKRAKRQPARQHSSRRNARTGRQCGATHTTQLLVVGWHRHKSCFCLLVGEERQRERESAAGRKQKAACERARRFGSPQHQSNPEAESEARARTQALTPATRTA